MQITPAELIQIIGNVAAHAQDPETEQKLKQALAEAESANRVLKEVREALKTPETADVVVHAMTAINSAFVAGQNKAAETFAADKATIEQQLKQAQTGWRIPQRGDKLKVVKPVAIRVNSVVKVGDIIKVCGNGAYVSNTETAPENATNDWTLDSTPCVMYKIHDGIYNFVPLECLEPA